MIWLLCTLKNRTRRVNLKFEPHTSVKTMIHSHTDRCTYAYTIEYTHKSDSSTIDVYLNAEMVEVGTG